MSTTSPTLSHADLIHPRSAAAPGGGGDPSAEGFVTVDGVEMYRITDYDLMPAFLMSVVSDSDLWMFLSSGGGLTAGRVDPDHALFPYETDDKLHRVHPFTGPSTLIRVSKDGRGRDSEPVLWEPFRDHGPRGEVTRNLYKTVSGNRVIFEEINHRLGLSFRYQWAGCDEFGFLRSASLVNDGNDESVSVEMLDGLLNIMPSGLNLAVMQQFSCLTNAYSRVEVDAQTRLAVFAMSSLLVDRAEPAEALRANTVWCRGLAGGRVVVDDDAVEAFRNDRAWPGAREIKGRRGAYLVHTHLTLVPGRVESWDLVADVDRSQAQAVEMRVRLQNEDEGKLAKRINVALDQADANLVINVASSDGLQCSADRATTAHHFANVLFNNMRGGVFADGYKLPGSDFAGFVAQRNHATAERHAELLAGFTGSVDYREVFNAAEATGDPDLLRLAYEYLPITFSRRHGDPSRPWNRFAIKIKDSWGNRILNYEGNWRDIFQNWESMCVSFPNYFESVIAKFVNASTADGFNPYRVTRDGIDWEVPEPDNPWASIGYWGDHQIIYLLKLLEHSAAFAPGQLEAMLGERLFTYADVPYRIKPYASVCETPNDTIVFDRAHQKRIDARVAEVGADGKLLHDADGELVRVSLAEKLLVPALSKLSNLVVDGGIWMNTQRPEWNDANNALVGDGVSMVTLCYLRRYAAFMVGVFESLENDTRFAVSRRVADWAGQVAAVLEDAAAAAGSTTDGSRREVLDRLGRAFSDYRQAVYAEGPGAAEAMTADAIAGLFRSALVLLDQAIDVNRRDDGLYHAYNLLALTGGDGTDARARVDHLGAMVEGQVAVMSTGRLDAQGAADLLESLYGSSLYREDQHSFLLYPDRALSGFFERNDLTIDVARSNALLSAMLDAGDTRLVERDASAGVRFNADFQKAADLDAAMTALAEDELYTTLVEENREAVLELYESVFNHRAFTGRSGGMYGYEGLGCIYWHMISKLLLATQESYFRALDQGESDQAVAALAEAYYRVRAGLSFNKTARQYGAFPTDPYSHTPGHRGAQQPGMTGQVKEEILTRLGELGVRIDGGQIRYRPTLLRRREFLTTPTEWTYFDVHGRAHSVELPAGSLGFTYAQVPMVYTQNDGPDTVITLRMADGSSREVVGDTLDAPTSAAIFGRDGQVARIDVAVPRGVIVLD